MSEATDQPQPDGKQSPGNQDGQIPREALSRVTWRQIVRIAALGSVPECLSTASRSTWWTVEAVLHALFNLDNLVVEPHEVGNQSTEVVG